MLRLPSALLVTGLACLVAIGVAGRAAAQQSQLPEAFRVGKPFPTLAFPSLETGRPASIADYRGERLILHVFASW